MRCVSLSLSSCLHSSFSYLVVSPSLLLFPFIVPSSLLSLSSLLSFFWLLDGRCITEKPLTFHNVSIFCFSMQFQAYFHMLAVLTLWKSAWNCGEKKKWTRCGKSTAPPPSDATFSVCCCVCVVCLCPMWSSHLPEKIGREQHVPDSFNHTLYLIKTAQLQLQCRKIQKNRPLDGSICLSPQETECNERFARQYRYEPPPEILLPFSRCVHHLSGPITYALTQNIFKITENTHTCDHEPSKTQPH